MKTIKKGFTLIELIIVMAIMSILMVAILSISTPAQRMGRRTNINETTYAMTDNISQTIQRTLEYADYAWILTDDSTGSRNPANTDQLKQTVVDFKNCYYNNIVIPKTSMSSPTYCKVPVYVLRLRNTGNADEKGKIYLSRFELNSNETFCPNPVWEELLNPAYFTGENEKYTISYALNAGEIVVDSALPRTDKDDARYRLSSEPTTVNSDSTNQAVSIVISSGVESDENGSIFVGPANVTVASVPFVNINSPRRQEDTYDRDGHLDGRVYGGIKARYILDGTKLTLQTNNDSAGNNCFKCPAEMGKGTSLYPDPFFNFASGKDVDTSKDIYYIFSYADEIDKQ